MLDSATSNIIFIGMSGAGKSFWAKKFTAHYSRLYVEFDELIGQSPELAALIKTYPGKDSAEKMGHYFGMPWDQGFADKEAAYLPIERRILAEYCASSGVVLDLTGSAIYHPQEMEKIARTGLVIYLETSAKKQKEMLKIFLENPKPVCWGGIFQQQPQQTPREALEACYPRLLDYRNRQYKKYAHVTLPYDIHKQAEHVPQLVSEIKYRLDGNKQLLDYL